MAKQCVSAVVKEFTEALDRARLRVGVLAVKWFMDRNKERPVPLPEDVILNWLASPTQSDPMTDAELVEWDASKRDVSIAAARGTWHEVNRPLARAAKAVAVAAESAKLNAECAHDLAAELECRSSDWTSSDALALAKRVEALCVRLLDRAAKVGKTMPAIEDDESAMTVLRRLCSEQRVFTARELDLDFAHEKTRLDAGKRLEACGLVRSPSRGAWVATDAGVELYRRKHGRRR